MSLTGDDEVSHETYRKTLHRLSSAQKSSVNASAYARWINRPAGRCLAAFLYRAGLTPNQVTLISGAVTAIGILGIALVRPTPTRGVVIGLALMLGYALDSADGQVARLRGGGSPLGEWLDHMVDCLKVSTIHLAVLICMYRYFDLDRAVYLLVPITWAALAAIMFFGLMLTDQFRRLRHGGVAPPPAGNGSTARSVLVAPTDYGVLAMVFLLLGLPEVFLAAYGALLAIYSVFVLAALVKWYRELAAVAPSRPGVAEVSA
jgi:phosphatidylglycerophosphate synthase